MLFDTITVVGILQQNAFVKSCCDILLDKSYWLSSNLIWKMRIYLADIFDDVIDFLVTWK